MIILITEEQSKVIANSLVGERVKVYYNLHKHTFSIQKNNIVVAHADFIKLRDVEFRVRPGGKEKVRQEKSKNVHAFVIGNLVEFCLYPCDELPEEPTGNVVTYNPYKNDSFVFRDTQESVYEATEVDMINSKNKIFVIEQ